MRTLRVLALLAAAVLVLAACGNGDDTPAAADGDGVQLVADDMFYEPDSFTVSAGTVEFTMTNEGAAEHDLVIEEIGDVEVIGLVGPGETGTGSVDLDPGTYTFYCSVPGHRESGMEGTLTVTE